ncbi:unnamed protein product [Adineta steineri]|uniref:Uncharacterized protein n=1 Tax=Adineta steineri TaxID=433720 RepID=A0A816FP17_9BILA|nr:unnamed protein product [Adineta steineri]CAF0829022.1 unnamed protein product [Adineta steineri]CAF1558160.1 unnamed protein product [Adineta steineri]CAF1663791.1 unnamed protein product [Adineta steineri]
MRWFEGKEEGEIVVGGNGGGIQSNQLNDPTEEKKREYFYVNEQQWIEITQNYSHLFDKIICLNDSFDSIFLQLETLVKDVKIKLI